MPWPKERYPCEKCSRQVHAASAAFLYPAALANKLCPNCYGAERVAEFKSVDDLWATVDEQHEALDEGNEEAGPAIAILRKACLDFLLETEPTNKGQDQ